MARTTSTQRGASRRTTRTASGGPVARGASSSRSKKKPAATSRASAPRTRPASRTSRRPAGPWVPVAIVALVAVLAWSLYPAMRLQYQASRRVDGLQAQYDTLKKRNDALRTQVAALKTPQGVEKAAREGLGYTKKGEHAYVVLPAGQATSTDAAVGGASEASVAGTPQPSLLQVILDAIFGVEQPAPTSTVEP